MENCNDIPLVGDGNEKKTKEDAKVKTWNSEGLSKTPVKAKRCLERKSNSHDNPLSITNILTSESEEEDDDEENPGDEDDNYFKYEGNCDENEFKGDEIAVPGTQVQSKRRGEYTLCKSSSQNDFDYSKYITRVRTFQTNDPDDKWECGICKRLLSSHKVAVNHIESLHLISKNKYECQECGSIKFTLGAIRTHMSRKHPKRKKDDPAAIIAAATAAVRAAQNKPAEQVEPFNPDAY